jgi:hypothetical protein
MDAMRLLAVVVGLYLVFRYIGSAIAIYRSQGLEAEVRFRVEPAAEFFAARDDHFRFLDQQLRRLGYAFVDAATMEQPFTKAWVSLYWSPKDQLAATVATMSNGIENFTYTEFTQLYRDGRVLGVSNVPVQSVYPEIPVKKSFHYPEFEYPASLIAIHRTLADRFAGDAEMLDYDIEGGFAQVQKYARMESDELVRMGYAREPIGSDGRRALTAKGAWLLTWRSIFPGNVLRQRTQNRVANRVLADSLVDIPLHVGDIHVVPSEGNIYTPIKILAEDEYGVHVAIYSNRYRAIPTAIGEGELFIGNMEALLAEDSPEDEAASFDIGVDHLALSREGFLMWGSIFVQAGSVEEDELKGYRLWSK